MSLTSALWSLASAVNTRLDRARLARRWATLRQLGMTIGDDVFLPASTWVDTSHCFLITIGDHVGFGEECLILAHDAQMDEFLDAARIGRVIVHPSCHIGARTVILPGVEIGPRTIVGANSVVVKSLPPDSVCAGNPARVICSLDEYLQKHRGQITTSPSFQYESRMPTLERRAAMRVAVREGDAYVVGGRSAELRCEGGTPRTGRRSFPDAPVRRSSQKSLPAVDADPGKARGRRD
jgi:maltose O-acetyltransferase